LPLLKFQPSYLLNKKNVAINFGAKNAMLCDCGTSADLRALKNTFLLHPIHKEHEIPFSLSTDLRGLILLALRRPVEDISSVIPLLLKLFVALKQ